MAKLINEIGNIYGYLTVIERAENNGSRAAWKCKCKCGQEVVVTGKLLRQGQTRSCGCLKSEILVQRNIERGGGSLIGQRFGKLTVIKEGQWIVRKNGHRDRTWICQCDCGNTTEVVHRYLRFGDTSSCGCLKSKGNATINRLLTLSKVKFENEYSFPDFCTHKGHPYKFDFAVFNDENELKFLIEYQGNIHFQVGTGWNNQESLEDIQRRDKIKYDYCKEHNITLYYITYLDDIEEKIEEFLHE